MPEISRRRASLESLQTLLWCAIAARRGEREPSPALPAADIYWVEVIQLAEQNRLLPLLLEGLKQFDREFVEAPEFEQISGFIDEQDRRCHQLLAVHARLINSLREAGIPAVTYKGPVLAEVIYGNHVLREFRDLDVLVRPDDFQRAIDVLRRHNLRIDDDMAAECHLAGRVGGELLVIDLHNRIMDFYLPPALGHLAATPDLKSPEGPGSPPMAGRTASEAPTKSNRTRGSGSRE